MSLHRPECDSLWVKWFSHLNNIPMVVFITSERLWLEMGAEQTIHVWTTEAPSELQRLEFWHDFMCVILSKTFMVHRVFTDKRNGSVGCVAVRDAIGKWSIGEAEANMKSGPEVEVWGRIAN